MDGEKCRMIGLTKGYVAIVSAVDFDALNQFKWCATISRKRKRVGVYAARSIRIGGRHQQVLMHREVLGLKFGNPLEGDHVNNKETLHNNRNNLRPATRSQQLWNTSKKTHNTSGHKGASLHKASGLWHSTIKAEGRTISLGYFKTAEEAHQAYRAGAAKYYGEFARFE